MALITALRFLIVSFPDGNVDLTVGSYVLLGTFLACAHPECFHVNT